MTSIGVRVRTLWALGVRNLLRVAVYRIGLRTGLHPVCRIRAEAPKGPFFKWPPQAAPKGVGGRSEWRDYAILFGHLRIDVGDSPPDWMTSVLTGQRHVGAEQAWWRIGDFDPAIGDIKAIWELSRFDWLLAMAQRACLGEKAEFDRLDRWLQDWVERNPPYFGPNWKCGQEASLRVLHLAATAMIFGQIGTASPSLMELVRLHLQRIAPTIQYAVAQDNNHGTSEAAALFIGGSWLSMTGRPEGQRWMNIGRKWLENRAARLIGVDGTFSQYSLNYHRLLLDTLCFCEVWRQRLLLPPFSSGWKARALAATDWLQSLINPKSGDGPNVGANDGAHILRLSDAPYRDYRPSVQLGALLFAGRPGFNQSDFKDESTGWLNISPSPLSPKLLDSRLYDDGGFAVLRRGANMLMLRYPRYKFRPSQSDVLHIDLWRGCSNILCDSGTLSYNTDPRWIEYFGGVEGHNSVQFDNRDQMPRLSRFLLGDWLHADRLQCLTVGQESVDFGVGYIDRYGVSHHRTVSLFENGARITDSVRGFAERAVLRWRLNDAVWRIEHDGKLGGVALGDGNAVDLSVICDKPITRCEVVRGWISRHYSQKSEISVFEIEVCQDCTIITDIRWRDA